MPWAVVSTAVVPSLPSFPYVYLFFAVPPGGVALGLSVEAAPAALSGRLRVGFYYPCVFFGGAAYMGPCNEMLGDAAAGATPIHALTYGFFTSAAAAASTNEVFGAAVAVDRGIIGATARLWRFT